MARQRQHHRAPARNRWTTGRALRSPIAAFLLGAVTCLATCLGAFFYFSLQEVAKPWLAQTGESILPYLPTFADRRVMHVSSTRPLAANEIEFTVTLTAEDEADGFEFCVEADPYEIESLGEGRVSAHSEADRHFLKVTPSKISAHLRCWKVERFPKHKTLVLTIPATARTQLGREPAIKISYSPGFSAKLDAPIADSAERTIAARDTAAVAGEAALVETSQSLVGGTVEIGRIENLPLNGRQFANLAAKIPGVGLGFHSDPTKSTQFSPQINDGNGRNVNYQIDGGDNNDDTVDGLLHLFPLETIEQFTFITSRSKAEYGRSNDGVMNIVTKSGTNETSTVGIHLHLHWNTSGARVRFTLSVRVAPTLTVAARRSDGAPFVREDRSATIAPLKVSVLWSGGARVRVTTRVDVVRRQPATVRRL